MRDFLHRPVRRSRASGEQPGGAQIRVLLLAACFFARLVQPASSVETVRVDAGDGAPRIVVDGRPVRARMFWGAPGSRPLALGTAGQQVEFEFSPAQDEPAQATMHFRFGQTAGEVLLDDIQVVDLTAGQDVVPVQGFESGMQDFSRSWTFWPPGEQNNVGTIGVSAGRGREKSAALCVTLTDPPDGRWPDFHIYHHANLALRSGHRYRVRFWARAEPARDLTVAFYRPGQAFTYLGGPPSPFSRQIKLAADAGVDFVSFPVHMPWPKPGEPVNWTTSDAQCQAVLEANPHALLLPRIGMEPPAWWREANPGDMMAWDQRPQKHSGAVVASPTYRRDAAERLAALIAHLEDKFGEHTAGYHPCGQNTGEWFYQETWGPALNGYAPGDLHAWRSWLAERYADDAALRAAWQQPQVTLASAEVPTPAARRAAPNGVLHDPQAGRPLIDFTEFQQQMMADCVCELARAARKASRGRKLVVFFYGYVFEFGAIRNGPATAGHYALRRVLDCSDIDVLCSPISYFDRGLGQSGPAMTAAESVALAGKMWLYEDDTRTYLGSGRFPGWADGVTTIEDTNRLLLRNTAQCALRNFGTWWMDLGATGWFDDPRMWAEMDRLKALDLPLLDQPLPFRPEVAAVIDEASMVRVAAGGQIVTVPGVYEVRRALGRMGAPYGQYLQDDVLAGRVPARMVVLLTSWRLSPRERRELLVATRERLRVWCYAPGYHEEHVSSLDAMQELTGFQMRSVSGQDAWAEPTELAKQLGFVEGFGVKQPVAPLFAAADATPAETLATWPDGSAAVALRQTADGWSLFVGPPGITSPLLRLAARKAGVHLFTQQDCNVYANGPYLVLHAAQDGPVMVAPGRRGEVFDLLSGQRIGPAGQVTVAMKKGDTRILRVAE
ncbi:MAG: beta-galactosidase [Pirellulaceae bacterium]|nr:beta-galactosidase [Pirellulaceae bacterium]